MANEKIVMDVKNYQCDICGKVVTQRKNLNKHFDRHRNLKCEVCGKHFYSSQNLKNHLRSHFDKNYFVICDMCGKNVSKWKLKRHQESHHQLRIRPIVKSQNFICRYEI